MCWNEWVVTMEKVEEEEGGQSESTYTYLKKKQFVLL